VTFTHTAIFSLVIAFAAIAGIIRYKRIESSYYPFIWLLWLGLINEIISIYVMQTGYSNAFNNNVFALLEALIITWQFRKWKLFERNTGYYILQSAFIVFWFIESIARRFEEFNSWFIIMFSMIIVLQSINMLNVLIFEITAKLIFHPVFLLSMAFIIYFTYSILVEVFWVYGLNRSRSFRVAVYEILAYVNLFTNLVYFIAIVWMPLKRQYLMRS
jgi:hypothetical protein